MGRRPVTSALCKDTQGATGFGLSTIGGSAECLALRYQTHIDSWRFSVVVARTGLCTLDVMGAVSRRVGSWYTAAPWWGLCDLLLARANAAATKNCGRDPTTSQ